MTFQIHDQRVISYEKKNNKNKKQRKGKFKITNKYQSFLLIRNSFNIHNNTKNIQYIWNILF